MCKKVRIHIHIYMEKLYNRNCEREYYKNMMPKKYKEQNGKTHSLHNSFQKTKSKIKQSLYLYIYACMCLHTNAMQSEIYTLGVLASFRGAEWSVKWTGDKVHT